MVSAGIFGLNMVIYDRDSSIILRLKPVKSQTFIFRPKLSFLIENHKNDNQDEFLDFDEFILHMKFGNFLEMTISLMDLYVKKLKKLICRVNS